MMSSSLLHAPVSFEKRTAPRSPSSYAVLRGISPLIMNMPSRTACGSARFRNTAPAASMSAKDGSASKDTGGSSSG